jgi:hypothetical protein
MRLEAASSREAHRASAISAAAVSLVFGSAPGASFQAQPPGGTLVSGWDAPRCEVSSQSCAL